MIACKYFSKSYSYNLFLGLKHKIAEMHFIDLLLQVFNPLARIGRIIDDAVEHVAYRFH